MSLLFAKIFSVCIRCWAILSWWHSLYCFRSVHCLFIYFVKISLYTSVWSDVQAFCTLLLFSNAIKKFKEIWISYFYLLLLFLLLFQAFFVVYKTPYFKDFKKYIQSTLKAWNCHIQIPQCNFWIKSPPPTPPKRKKHV